MEKKYLEMMFDVEDMNGLNHMDLREVCDMVQWGKLDDQPRIDKEG